MDNMKHAALIAILAGVLVTAAPLAAAAADREQQQLMADLRILQMQTQELHVLVASLTQVLESVTTMVDEQVMVTRKGFADSRLLVDRVAAGVRILREKMDDTNVRISSFSQEIEALRLSIPRMPVPVLGADGEAVEGSAAAAGATFEPVLPVQPSPGISPQRLYDMAWADYSTGQWSLAITGFDAYLKAFPRSAQADDAQFYIGETLYNDGRFADAVAAYEQVASDYPNGETVPDAHYKRGLALDRLGHTELARAAFETVVNEFPDSRTAALARQAIDRLNRP